MIVRLAENGCDFCDSDRKASWVYPAHDIALPEQRTMSQSDWNACDDCHLLIEAGNRRALCDHAASVLARKFSAFGMSRKQAAAGVKQIHDRFFEARFGKARRI